MLLQSALAALVIFYSLGLIQPFEFHDIFNIRRIEFCDRGVRSGRVCGRLERNRARHNRFAHNAGIPVADPPVYVLRRKPGTNVSRPQSPEHPEDESFPGLVLLRLEEPIFFAHAAQFAHKVEPLVRASEPRVVAVDASGLLDLEYTALKMLHKRPNGKARIMSSCG
jgi:SulP family sulfate permease